MNAMPAPAPRAASGDPVGGELLGELLDLVRDTERAARVAQRSAYRSEKNRIGMLYIHSLFALTIAPLFAITSLAAPAFAVMREVPGAPYSPALVLGVGGLVLGMSAAGANRRLAFIGLGMLSCWYATMSVTFFASAIVWFAEQHPHSLTDVFDLLVADNPKKVSVYAVPLYAHFTAVMVRHMITLRGKALDAKALES